MNKHLLLTTILLPAVMMAEAQVSVVIDAESDNFPISPYIYGKNGATSDQATPTNAADMLRMREAGLRFARMNNGNNATKYN